MNIIRSILHILDRCTDVIGRTASWCSVLMVLVTFYIVVSRYVFNTGSIAIQESVIYLNALLFLLTAGFTLKHDGHVRVDIFYGPATARYRAWVNLLGGMFLLLPVAGFILWISWDYVTAAWRIRESSPEAGGIPYVYLLKSLIVVMTVTLLVQGLTEILRNFIFLFFEEAAPEERVDPTGGAL